MTTQSPKPGIEVAVRKAVSNMAPAHVRSLASAVQTEPAFSSAARALALGAVANPNYREQADDVLIAWANDPGVTGATISLCLRAALAVRESTLAEETVELVWTGPTSPSVPIRLTREVLLDLIFASKQKLTVVSFAAYRVGDVINSLLTAARRGVEIRLVLEGVEESHGRLSHDAADAFERLKGHARFFVWPAELRSWSGDAIGALHAKAVVADAAAAFVTSANLTGHALTANMELGLLIKGGEVPRRLESHLDELVAREILRAVQ